MNDYGPGNEETPKKHTKLPLEIAGMAQTKTDDGVQASWQGPFFSEITRPCNFGMCFGDFGPKSGRRCAGFLAGAFFCRNGMCLEF